ncbi:MAG: APC family permease [Bacteroidetes bacterium]|nr:APC family permease [Bacteroidota bacterium]
MQKTKKDTKEQRFINKSMGLWSATAIGMGAMIGAGIFALVGIAVEIAGAYAYISFIIAGILALLTAYSMSKLAAAFPEKGGSVAFLNEAFGKNIVPGTLNLMTVLGYIIVTSLYARAFGEYGLALIGKEDNNLLLHFLSSGVVLLFIGINLTGASMVGKAGFIATAIQTAVLLVFGIAGLTQMDTELLKPSSEFSLTGVILVTSIVFMSYEGFGLVANTAEDIRKPRKNLPRSLYLSVIIVMVIYVIINIAVIGNLSIEKIIQAKDYVLAEAAIPVFGSAGFIIMGIAALFSTSSAINATVYGPVYMLQETAKAGEIPTFFKRNLWNHKAGVALLIIGASILIVTNLFNLQTIAETGSLIFLVVYLAVNLANFKLYKATGSKRWIVILAIVSTGLAFVALVYFLFTESNISLFTFLGISIFSLLVEILFHRIKKRK